MSGLAAGVMAILITRHGIPGYAAIAMGVGAGAAIGLLHGAWLTKLGVALVHRHPRRIVRRKRSSRSAGAIWGAT